MTTEGRMPTVPDLRALTRLVEERPGLYLRYSKGPGDDAEAGPSRDYEAQVSLPGWSVTTITPEPWWPRPLVDWVARRLCKYAELGEQDGRRPWLLAGAVVGLGPDHEPLVTAIEPVAWIDPQVIDEAQRHYHAHFAVGRDSRAAG